MKAKTNMLLMGAYTMFGLAFFSNEHVYNNIETIFLLIVSTIAIHLVSAKTAFRNGFNIGSSWTQDYIFKIIGKDMSDLVISKMNEEAKKTGG